MEVSDKGATYDLAEVNRRIKRVKKPFDSWSTPTQEDNARKTDALERLYAKRECIKNVISGYSINRKNNA